MVSSSNTSNNKWYSLAICTLAFAANFAAWTLFSILGLQIRTDLMLSETGFGLLLATPILSGVLVSLPSGLLAERFGGRVIFFWQTLIVALSLLLLPYAKDFVHYLLIGLLLGISGGTFVAGISYVSRCFESSLQGTAMGVFGAGAVGAAITNLFAPSIILAFGWQTVPSVYGLVLLVVAIALWFLTKPPNQVSLKKPIGRNFLLQQLEPLRELRAWRFALYYYFVFGGFLSLTLWLPQYYVGEYGLDLRTASFVTLLFTLPAAVVRALGGWFADNLGARRINWAVFWVCLVCLFFLSYPRTTMTIHGIDRSLFLTININLWVFTFLIFTVGVAMGFGAASIYRIIYDYYPEHLGTVGGFVGAAGAFGGFSLPIFFGVAADITGIRSSCFMLLYGVLAGCMILMFYGIKIDAFKQRVRKAQSDNFLKL